MGHLETCVENNEIVGFLDEEGNQLNNLNRDVW